MTPPLEGPVLRSGFWFYPKNEDKSCRVIWRIGGNTMGGVAERVKKIVVDRLVVAPELVTEDASFEDLGADSLVVVELVMAFEEEFGVLIPDSAADHLLTVGDAVRFLEKKAILSPKPSIELT